MLDDPTVNKLYIIMEYMANGSLMGAINKMTVPDLSKIWKYVTTPLTTLYRYFRDIVCGLIYRNVFFNLQSFE